MDSDDEESVSLMKKLMIIRLSTQSPEDYRKRSLWASNDSYTPYFIQKSTEFFKDVGQAEVNEKRDPDRLRYALHVAAHDKNLPEIERLLSMGADINAGDKWNQTPLHEAAYYNKGDSHFHTIEMLLKSGADVHAKGSNGVTPLHNSIGKSDVKTVKLLLNFGADVNVRDEHGNTPLSGAVNSKFENLEVFKLLLENGSDINNADIEKYTPLHCACAWGSFKVIEFLVENGADVDAFNDDGHTPLMSMLLDELVPPDFFKFLIKYSDVNIVDSKFKDNILRVSNTCKKSNIWKTIVEHVAKHQFFGFYINPSVLNSIKKSKKLSSHLNQCAEELEVAQSTKILNCWVSYFHILMDDSRKLKNYAGNQELVQNFYKTDFLKIFPAYGQDMLKNMDKGMEARKLFDQSSITLIFQLPIFSLNHLIIKDVLDCLSSKDYNRLILEV